MAAKSRCIAMTAGALVVCLGVVPAGAQGSGGGAAAGGAPMVDPTDPGGDAATRPNAGSPLPEGGTTKDLTMPGQGGVADTGLGGSTKGTGNGAVSGRPSRDTGAAGVPGTGMSVGGPAGQGIDGQGVSRGITAAPTGGGGSGTGGNGAGGTSPGRGGSASGGGGG